MVLAWSAARELGKQWRYEAALITDHKLIQTGPYRFIRHPLYVGEIVAVLGMVVRAPGAATMLCWVALVVLQIWRASAEERLLVSSLTGYDAYLQRTARLVPGLY